MPHERRTSGVILRTQPLTESSLLVRWLTPDAGRITTVAKGARKPKSAFHGRLDLFFLCDLSYFPSRRSDLHTLKEVQVRNAFYRLRENHEFLETAAQPVRLIERSTETETPLEEIYPLLIGFLESLSQASVDDRRRPLLRFLLQYLEVYGLSPGLESIQPPPAFARAARQFLSSDPAASGKPPVSNAEEKALENFLASRIQEEFGLNLKF